MGDLIDIRSWSIGKALEKLVSRRANPSAFPAPHHYEALLAAYQRRGQAIYDADAILSEKSLSGVMVEVDSARLERLERAAAIVRRERLKRQPRCPE